MENHERTLSLVKAGIANIVAKPKSQKSQRTQGNIKDEKDFKFESEQTILLSLSEIADGNQ